MLPSCKQSAPPFHLNLPRAAVQRASVKCSCLLWCAARSTVYKCMCTCHTGFCERAMFECKPGPRWPVLLARWKAHPGQCIHASTTATHHHPPPPPLRPKPPPPTATASASTTTALAWRSCRRSRRPGRLRSLRQSHCCSRHRLLLGASCCGGSLAGTAHAGSEVRGARAPHGGHASRDMVAWGMKGCGVQANLKTMQQRRRCSGKGTAEYLLSMTDRQGTAERG